MNFLSRLRRPGTRKAGVVALTVAFAALLAACGQDHPDSIFHNRTDVNRDVDYLFKLLIGAGTGVFIFVETILIVALVKFRKRPGQPEPKHVHGNTTLEIMWTVIPALILGVIAVPTVRTIFKTQAAARADALQVEVYGHQWWWEFRYPQYTMTGANGKVDTVVTANELYLPIGKTVNFTLRSRDVIHSFWVPALSGKRDVVSNHTNYLWYTPDSTTEAVFNGACVEYCGTSHANMRFKAFTVTQADFDSWIEHQKLASVDLMPPPAPVAPAAGTPAKPGAPAVTAKPATTPAMAAAAATPAPVVQAGFVMFPREKMPVSTVPQTPYPEKLKFDDGLLANGNAAAGEKIVNTNMCIACHTIRGNPMMQAVLGPNLTHVATRTTIGAGLYPNDAQHLARWVKNAPSMKPGIIMPTFGIGEYDPVTLKGIVKTGFTDAQVSDIVAYLQTLK
ncbi:MAG: cytochrome c oxidase subunit II [Gemmatimonadaceae bacterium]